MKLQQTMAVAAMVLLPTFFAHAGGLGEDMTALCDKVKQCTADEMAGSAGMTPDMRAMIMQSLDAACAGINAQFQAAASNHVHSKPAKACLRSMQALSCAQLQANADPITPECGEYEALVEQKG